MPRPDPTETKDAFIARYMGDSEARKSFPDEKQRYAVALSLFEHRNTLVEAANNLGYNSEKHGAEPFGGRHIQTGIVGYPEMKHPISGKQGINILVEKDVLDTMRPTMKGKPIFNWAHRSGDVSEALAKGEAVGVMTSSYWNGDDAWEHCDYFVWDKEAKANCRNGFRLSNAWKEDEIEWTPGVHNGTPYDGRLKAAHYTHMAIVPNPRYEGAVIYANSKGGVMSIVMKLLGKAEPVELGKETKIQVEGKERTLLECVNALAAADAAAATVTAPKGSELKDEDVVEVDGKKRTILEMKNALAAADKAAAAKPVEKPVETPVADKKIEMTKAEFENAVDGRVKDALDKAVGEGFFNGIAALVAKRGGADKSADKPAGGNSERDRLAHGKKNWGSRSKAAA